MPEEPQNSGTPQPNPSQPSGEVTNPNGAPATPSEPSAPSAPAAPAAPSTPETPPSTPSLSDEQISSIKADVSKDVAGKVSQEVSKSVIEKIGEALGLTKKEEDALPTNAQELQKAIDSAVEKKVSELSKSAEEQDQQEQEDYNKAVENTVNGWHLQYNQLAAAGKVPAIKDANNLQDEGMVARRKLIMAIGKIIEEVRKTDPNSNYIPSISEALIRFPDVLKAPPGADLPISGNTASREGGEAINYHEDVHGKSVQEIIDQGE